jgi:hypothetical protein
LYDEIFEINVSLTELVIFVILQFLTVMINGIVLFLFSVHQVRRKRSWSAHQERKEKDQSATREVVDLFPRGTEKEDRRLGKYFDITRPFLYYSIKGPVYCI